MALSQSALLELLDALNASDSVDLVRTAVLVMLQELIEAEATAVIGADRHERTDTRLAQRNGHRPRVFSTKAGDLELAIGEIAHGVVLPEPVGTPAPD
jgi:putative transposase